MEVIEACQLEASRLDRGDAHRVQSLLDTLGGSPRHPTTDILLHVPRDACDLEEIDVHRQFQAPCNELLR